ncbi:hypothetical protein ACFYPC_09555 [Streptomyces sp. NPDC005808]|uniref:hypothetical protein n=1 Tax=Streptomyces sp. NPDC005808 TaxID=3364734 RepID=UPI00367C563D
MRNQARTGQTDPLPAHAVACGGCGGPAHTGDRIRPGHGPAFLRWRICAQCSTVSTRGRALLAAVRQHAGHRAASAVEQAGVEEVARLVRLATVYYLDGTNARPTDHPRPPWSHLAGAAASAQVAAARLRVDRLRQSLGVPHPSGLPCRVCGTVRDQPQPLAKPVERGDGWGRLVEARRDPTTAELVAAHERQHAADAAPVVGWTEAGFPSLPVCGPCATVERAARRADLLFGITNYREQVAAFHCWAAYGHEGDKPRAGMVRLTGWHPAADHEGYRSGPGWSGPWAHLGSEQEREEARRVIRAYTGRDTDEEARQRTVDAYLARRDADDAAARLEATRTRQDAAQRVAATRAAERIRRLEDGLERERHDRAAGDGELVGLVSDMTRMAGARR